MSSIVDLAICTEIIFEPRSFKFYVVIDIQVTDKLGGKIKRGVAPRGRGTCEYT